jgi:hypothetical protein
MYIFTVQSINYFITSFNEKMYERIEFSLWLI